MLSARALARSCHLAISSQKEKEPKRKRTLTCFLHTRVITDKEAYASKNYIMLRMLIHSKSLSFKTINTLVLKLECI
jgi:hypothetical protein